MKHLFTILIALMCIHLLDAQNIVFEEKNHDFGLVSDDSLSYTFRFENQGGIPIAIELLDVPCGSCKGCVKVKHTKGYLKKGEKGEIEVKYVGYPHNGLSFQKNIVIGFTAEKLETTPKEAILPLPEVLQIQGSISNIPTASTTSEPQKFIPAEQIPQEINLRDIQKKVGYPYLARMMDLEGTIVFRVLVDENGNYSKHLPPKSGHPILINAIEEELCKLSFSPAKQGGKNIKFWVNVPFMFKLN